MVNERIEEVKSILRYNTSRARYYEEQYVTTGKLTSRVNALIYRGRVEGIEAVLKAINVEL